jgi:hypothetical protein
VDFEEQIEAIRADQGAGPEERALLEQNVVSADRLGEGVGANECWRLELGTSREGAFFKPVNGVNASLAYLFGHTRQSTLLAELSAYRLAQALGPRSTSLFLPASFVSCRRSTPTRRAHSPESASTDATRTCSRAPRL